MSKNLTFLSGIMTIVLCLFMSSCATNKIDYSVMDIHEDQQILGKGRRTDVFVQTVDEVPKAPQIIAQQKNVVKPLTQKPVSTALSTPTTFKQSLNESKTNIAEPVFADASASNTNIKKTIIQNDLQSYKEEIMVMPEVKEHFGEKKYQKINHKLDKVIERAEKKIEKKKTKRDVAKATEGGNTLTLLSLIFGGAAIAFLLLALSGLGFVLVFMSLAFALIAIGLGIIALAKGQNKAMSILAIVFGGLISLIDIWIIIVILSLFYY